MKGHVLAVAGTALLLGFAGCAHERLGERSGGEYANAVGLPPEVPPIAQTINQGIAPVDRAMVRASAGVGTNRGPARGRALAGAGPATAAEPAAPGAAASIPLTMTDRAPSGDAALAPATTADSGGAPAPPGTPADAPRPEPSEPVAAAPTMPSPLADPPAPPESAAPATAPAGAPEPVAAQPAPEPAASPMPEPATAITAQPAPEPSAPAGAAQPMPEPSAPPIAAAPSPAADPATPPEPAVPSVAATPSPTADPAGPSGPAASAVAAVPTPEPVAPVPVPEPAAPPASAPESVPPQPAAVASSPVENGAPSPSPGTEVAPAGALTSPEPVAGLTPAPAPNPTAPPMPATVPLEVVPTAPDRVPAPAPVPAAPAMPEAAPAPAPAAAPAAPAPMPAPDPAPAPAPTTIPLEIIPSADAGPATSLVAPPPAADTPDPLLGANPPIMPPLDSPAGAPAPEVVAPPPAPPAGEPEATRYIAKRDPDITLAAGDPAPVPPGATLRSDLPAPKTEQAGKIAARVGDEVITMTELTAAVQERGKRHFRGQRLSPADINMLAAAVLSDMVDRSVVMQEAKRRVKDPKKFQAVLAAADHTFKEAEVPALMRKYHVEDERALKDALIADDSSYELARENFRQRFITGGYIEQQLGSKMKVDLPEKLAYYNQHLREFDRPAQVTWREVVIEVSKSGSRTEAHRRAEDALARLRRGEDFGRLAAAASDGPTRQAGGRWQTTPGGYSVPAVNQALETLPIGQVSPILEGPTSFHIVRVEERRAAGPARFDEVQDDVEQAVYREKSEKITTDFIRKLRAQTYVWTMFSGTPNDPMVLRARYSASKPAAR